MKKTLYAVFKQGIFKEAAYCIESKGIDEADAYIRSCEKKYGLFGFSYSFGDRAEKALPIGYQPRTYYSRPTQGNKKLNTFIAKFKRAEDDGVNYDN